MTLHDLDGGAGDPSTGSGAAVCIHRVGVEDWASHRDLRVAMLAADPMAFWADHDEAASRDEQQWRQEIVGPRVHLQARQSTEVLGGIAPLPEGYTPDHEIPADRALVISLRVRPSARGTGSPVS